MHENGCKMIRTIELYADMSGDFEIIQTDAPDDEIINCIIDMYKASEKNTYEYLLQKGYYVFLCGCQDDFSDYNPLDIDIDASFNIYEYLDN